MKVRIEVAEAKLVWNGNLGSTPVYIEYVPGKRESASLVLERVGAWPLSDILQRTADGHDIGSVYLEKLTGHRETWYNPNEVVAAARALHEAIVNVTVVDDDQY